MLKNYFKIAWRNLLKGRLYSVINITGLAIGIACCLLIGLYIFQELRYDRFHEDADRIYRVNLTLANEAKSTTIATTPRPLADMLVNQFPEVGSITSLEFEDGVIRYNNELSNITFAVTDSNFFNVFSFEIKAGYAISSISSPNEVLIPASLAKKLFDNENPIGKVIDLRINETFYPATVGAVIENPPSYSSITYDILIPEPLWQAANPRSSRSSNWGTMAGVRYAKLAPNTDLKQLSSDLNEAMISLIPERFRINREYSFQPLTDIHFGKQVMWSQTPTVNPNFVLIAAIIAFVILGISCINFTSLSIGYSSRRTKEIGMRKVIGAERKQLIMQFWSETFFIALISLILGLFFTEILSPYFSALVGDTTQFRLFEHPAILLIIGIIVLLTGILAGSYPAIYLSKFKPSQVFQKQSSHNSNHKLIPVLTTIQFSLAVVLIVGTVFMNNQMQLLSDKNLGFDDEYVVQLETPYREGEKILQVLRNELSNETSIRGISGSWNSLDGEGVSFNNIPFQADGKEIRGSKFGVSSNLPEVLDIKLLAGNPLSETDETTNEVLVNEALVRSFGWENAIGKRIDGAFDESYTVKGVVQNFHFQSLHKGISPLILEPNEALTKIYLKVNGQQLSSTINTIEEAWIASAPDLPFQFSFLNDQIEKQYQSDQKWVAMVQAASYLSILLSCLGLFGLATLASSKRKKEISIRKVMGATVSSIVFLLSKDFLKPVLIGLIIAMPISWYMLTIWLQDFAYKIELNPLTFFIAGMTTILIALLTVSWQSIKAAVANPVESLRSE